MFSAGRWTPSSRGRATLPRKSPGRWDVPSATRPARCAASRSAHATCSEWRPKRSPRFGRGQAGLPAADQARAARRRRGRRALELPLPDGGQCGAAGADSRQCGGAQGVAPDAALRRALLRSVRERRCSRRRVPVPALVARRCRALDGRPARRQHLLHGFGVGRQSRGRRDRRRLCHLGPRARRQGPRLRARRRRSRACRRNADRRRILQRRPVLLRHQAHLRRGLPLRGLRRRRRGSRQAVSLGFTARSGNHARARGAHGRRRGRALAGPRSRRPRGPSADRREACSRRPPPERRTSPRRCWWASITRWRSCARRPSGLRSAS